jgi:nitrogen fixation NifU-like protein
VGTAGRAADGDVMTIYIRVRDERIREISFQCKGCPAAIACGSMTTELAKARGLDHAAQIADETVAAALGGLPPEKRHCSNLGPQALANAIWDYVVRSVERQLARRRRRRRSE